MEGGAAHPSEWHWLWEAYIAGVCAAAIAAVFLLNERFPGNAPTVAALLAALAAWALTFGRGVPRSGELTWRTITFVVVAVALLVGAIGFSRVAVAAIPAIYPIVFRLCRCEPRSRRASRLASPR